MRVAIPVWQGRVSPVFDTASRLLIVDLQGMKTVSRTEVPLPERLMPRRAGKLAELGVDLLVCGAISRALCAMIDAKGIKVIPWISGNVEDVVGAHCEGRLPDPRFLMPGLRRRRRRCRGGGGQGLTHRGE